MSSFMEEQKCHWFASSKGSQQKRRGGGLDKRPAEAGPSSCSGFLGSEPSYPGCHLHSRS